MNKKLHWNFLLAFICFVAMTTTNSFAKGPIVTTMTGTNPTCGGFTNGTASVDATGGWGPYTYLWNTGQTSSTIYGLGAGLYIVTVTDMDLAYVIDSITLTAPSNLDGQINVADVCNAPGDVSADITGGVTPYTYSWTNGSTTQNQTGLSAGLHCVTVTDANFCSIVRCVTVLDPLAVDVQTIDSQCAMLCDGSAMAAPTGGVAPYTYIWNTGQTSQIIFPLGPGSYTVTVTDGNGCTAVGTGIVSEPPPIVCDLTIVNPGCSGGANTGKITADVSGGVPGYTLTWNNGQTGNMATNLSAGTYVLTIIDANNCRKDTAIVLTASGNNITVIATSTNVSCFQGNDGTATAVVSGGNGNYSFAWNTGATTQTITNLSMGVYEVTVTDSDGCEGTSSVAVTEPPFFTCDVSIITPITNGNDGSLQVAANGGTAPYTYAWGNGMTTATISNLGAGTYTVTVTDANNCESVCAETLVSTGPVLGKLGDYVWEDTNKDGIQDANEPGIRNVVVTLNGTTSAGVTVQETIRTDSDGMYMFNDLEAGTYKLSFRTPGNFMITLADAGSDDAVDSDINAMGMTPTYTLGSGDTILTIDAGYYDACDNFTDPGTIGYDEEFCGPGFDPAPIIGLDPPQGGTGAIEYLWMVSTTSGPFNTTSFQPIPNSNTPTYDPGVIYESKYYARCIRRANCDFLETNIVSKIVLNDSIAHINGPSPVCINEPATYTATDAGPGATYTWDFGPNATPRTATGRTHTVVWTNFGQRTISLTVKTPNCEATNIKKVSIITDPTICGSSISFRTNITDTRNVELIWETNEEVEQFKYQVQRSMDGINFSTLGEVLGNLGRTGMNFYMFTDESPRRGHNFYRIHRVSVDTGEEFDTQVEELMFAYDSEMVLVFPNPATGAVSIERIETFNAEGLIQILNAQGQVVLEAPMGREEFMKTINTSNLLPGVYVFKVRYNTHDIETHRVMVK